MTHAHPSTPFVLEKRDCIRISLNLQLEYKTVDNQTLETESADMQFEDSHSLKWIDQLKRLDREAHAGLKKLNEKSPLLAQQLQLLHHKIDTITQHIVLTEKQQTDPSDNRSQCHIRRINLSEDGLAFACQRALYKGSYLALRLFFLESYTSITVFAEVLRCENKKNDHQVAVKFKQLTEMDRKKIYKEIVRAQRIQQSEQNQPSAIDTDKTPPKNNPITDQNTSAQKTHQTHVKQSDINT